MNYAKNKPYSLLIISILLLSLVLNGCAKVTCYDDKRKKKGKRYHLEDDIGPKRNERIPDVSSIPDAKPKAEPKSKYGNPKKYTVFNKSYTVMHTSKGYKERGTASWYGKKFHGYKTSNGEVYDMYGMSAAHKTLPLPTYARVTNLANGKSVIVKINDRGPFHEDRIIDLSYAAAGKLGILGKGTAKVEVQAIDHNDKDMPQLYLQIGAFSMENSAKKLASEIHKVTKDHPVMVRKSKSKRSNLYHVHIGPIKDELLMDQLKKKLTANKFPKPVAVRH